MVELARAYGKEPVALSSIAQAEGLSLRYLEQLVLRLRRRGLVESVRGARGGYRLSALPCQVTVGRVIRALEGPIAPVGCVSETGSSTRCQREASCSSRQVWQQLRDSINQVLDSITLADLCSPRQPAGENSLKDKIPRPPQPDCQLCFLVPLCPGEM
jgi:Rrf2 family protein